MAADRVVVLALVATSGDNGTCAAAVRRADRRSREEVSDLKNI